MATLNILNSQQSIAAVQPPCATRGSWPLAGSRALTLHPRRASVLEVVRGRVWLTVSAPSLLPQPGPVHWASSDAAGAFAPVAMAQPRIDLPATFSDHILKAGDRLAVPAGARVVVEAWESPGQGAAGAAFRWDLETRPVLPETQGAAAFGVLGAAVAQVLRGARRWALGVSHWVRPGATAPCKRHVL